MLTNSFYRIVVPLYRRLLDDGKSVVDTVTGIAENDRKCGSRMDAFPWPVKELCESC
jgi:hypothetical protein